MISPGLRMHRTVGANWPASVDPLFGNKVPFAGANNAPCDPALYPGIVPAVNCYYHGGYWSYNYWGYLIQGRWIQTAADSAWIFANSATIGAPEALDQRAATMPNGRGHVTNREKIASMTLPSSGVPIQIQPLKEGIERFLITDINNPGASAFAQSASAVMFDNSYTAQGGLSNASEFNHIPGGANVLFMDGHVEFAKYPQPVGSNAYNMTREAHSDGYIFAP